MDGSTPQNIGKKEERYYINSLIIVGPYLRYGKFGPEEHYVGEGLVPVGKCCNEYLLLYVSETDKIYCSLGKCGNTTWKPWEYLITN